MLLPGGWVSAPSCRFLVVEFHVLQDRWWTVDASSNVKNGRGVIRFPELKKERKVELQRIVGEGWKGGSQTAKNRRGERME